MYRAISPFRYQVQVPCGGLGLGGGGGRGSSCCGTFLLVDGGRAADVSDQGTHHLSMPTGAGDDKGCHAWGGEEAKGGNGWRATYIEFSRSTVGFLGLTWRAHFLHLSVPSPPPSIFTFGALLSHVRFVLQQERDQAQVPGAGGRRGGSRRTTKRVEFPKQMSTLLPLSFPLLPSRLPYLAGIKQCRTSPRVHQIHRGPACKQPSGNVIVAHDTLEEGTEGGG